MNLQLLRDIREQVISLLFSRHVFRTHQEIVRRNPRLTGNTKGIFCIWAQVVYQQATALGVRRLASGTFQSEDVNLIRFFDSVIQSPDGLYRHFEHLFGSDVERASGQIIDKKWPPGSNSEDSVCKQLVGEDRKEAIRVAEKTNLFASKRVAHHVPVVHVDTKYSDLDEAIDVLTKLTEKYSAIAASVERDEVSALPTALSPAIAPVLAHMAKNNCDLSQEMKSRCLPPGWNEIFLEPWATSQTVELPLGDMAPPRLGSQHD